MSTSNNKKKIVFLLVASISIISGAALLNKGGVTMVVEANVLYRLFSYVSGGVFDFNEHYHVSHMNHHLSAEFVSSKYSSKFNNKNKNYFNAG